MFGPITIPLVFLAPIWLELQCIHLCGNWTEEPLWLSSPIVEYCWPSQTHAPYSPEFENRTDSMWNSSLVGPSETFLTLWCQEGAKKARTWSQKEFSHLLSVWFYYERLCSVSCQWAQIHWEMNWLCSLCLYNKQSQYVAFPCSIRMIWPTESTGKILKLDQVNLPQVNKLIRPVNLLPLHGPVPTLVCPIQVLLEVDRGHNKHYKWSSTMSLIRNRVRCTVCCDTFLR